MTQKILAAHAGLDTVKAGQLILVNLDLVLGNDITTPVAINEFEAAGFQSVFDKSRIALVMDHFVPNKDIKAATQCQQCRNFARRFDIDHYYDVGTMGIEHALLPEPYATEAELRGRLCLMEIDSVAPQLAAFVAVRSSATDSLRHRQAALFLQGYDMAVAEINEALAHDNPATCDSLAQLLQRSYSVSDTLVYPVISRLPRLRPSAKPQRADAEAALVWLRDRDQERAEYRIIKPTYSLNHLFWQNGL